MDIFLLVFASTLLVAVLFSALAGRTVLSTAVLFLLVGVVLGPDATGVLQISPDSEAVSVVSEIALFVVLFTDGMHLGWRDLRSAWRLPGRTLGWGLPLTLLITALLAHFLVGLDWPQALLVGAILSPTDPVFAAALVGNEKVPRRLRRLLNVESGLNDGLALPFVMVFLALSGGVEVPLWVLALQLLAGAALGIALPWLVIRALRLRIFETAGVYEPLVPVAIGLALFAICGVSGANLYIAAFAAGVTVATVGERQRAAFRQFGEITAELLKLLALMVFGALFSIQFFVETPWTAWIFAVLALVLARPLALFVSFLGSKLAMREQLAAMWFGPKGFASVVYVLIVVSSGVSGSDLIFHVVALTIGLSIIAHASTDVLVARAFEDVEETPVWHGAEPAADPDDGPPQAASASDDRL